jgi:hypothetical protein
MSLRVSSVFVFSCADSGLVEGLIPRTRSHTNSIRKTFVIVELMMNGNRPERLIHQRRRSRRRRRTMRRRREDISCPVTSFKYQQFSIGGINFYKFEAFTFSSHGK